MALLAERHGANIAAVAWTQALRVTLVVSVVPWGLIGLGALARTDTTDALVPFVGAGRMAWVHGMPWLMWALWTALVCLPTHCLHRRQWPNAWLMAPLLFTIGLMAVLPGLLRVAGQPALVWMAPPPGALEFAQLCLGMTLAARLDRRAWKAAPRLTMVAIGAVLGSLVLCGALAVFLAWCGPQVPQAGLTHGLSMAPGGMAEMALLARQSGAWLPEVIATHVLRLALILCLSPWLVRWVRRHATPPSEGAVHGA